MICADCGAKAAAVFLRRSDSQGDDQGEDLALCEACARARGIAAGPAGLDIRLEGLIGAIDGDSARRRRVACPSCGSELSLLLRESRLGCAACADSFRQELRRLLASRDAGRPVPPLLREDEVQPPESRSRTSALPFPLSSPAFSPIGPDSPEGDVVLRSFVRVSRNLSGLSFPGSPVGGPAPSRGRIAAAFAGLPHWRVETLADLSGSTRLALGEAADLPRSYSSAEGATFAASSALPLYALEDETDHLRAFARLPGLRASWALRSLLSLEGELARVLGAATGSEEIFSRDPEFGWLCAKTEDCGPGLVASAQLHLPALAMAGLQDRLFRALMAESIQVRGSYSEDGASIGSLFELIATGASAEKPEELVAVLESAARKAVAAERRTRVEILKSDPEAILDAAGRALGILERCRRIGLEEASGLISSLRLAALSGMLNREARPSLAADLGGVVCALGPGSISLALGMDAPARENEVDALRASFLKAFVEGVEIDAEEDRCSRD